MILVFIFIIGLALGSFVNALVWRIHELEGIKSKKQRKALSPITGQSMCTHCKHALSPLDLVPVFSWLALRGRCRYCNKSIGAQYPLVELATASSFLVFYTYWPYELLGFAWLVFGMWLILATVFMALLVYDFKWYELPDSLVATVSVLALIVGVLLVVVGAWDASQFAQAMGGGALLFGLFYGLFQVSKGRWIGGGDVKLAPALGFIAGSALNAMLLLFIASLIGSIVGIPMLVFSKNKKNIKLPFGPLLILALYVVFFAGQSMIDWYTASFLYL